MLRLNRIMYKVSQTYYAILRSREIRWRSAAVTFLIFIVGYTRHADSGGISRYYDIVSHCVVSYHVVAVLYREIGKQRILPRYRGID